MDRDSLPRVPDTHGDVVDEKLFSDLYIRTSWVDAQVALDQIDKVSPQLQWKPHKTNRVWVIAKLHFYSILMSYSGITVVGVFKNIKDPYFSQYSE